MKHIASLSGISISVQVLCLKYYQELVVWAGICPIIKDTGPELQECKPDGSIKISIATPIYTS